jgi:hypothetical protein
MSFLKCSGSRDGKALRVSLVGQHINAFDEEFTGLKLTFGLGLPRN